MKLFIKLLFLFSIFFLFTAGYCDSEEDECQTCVDAQRDLCEALLANGCSATATNSASRTVKDVCKNGTAKVNTIRSACQLGDNLNCVGFPCN